MRLLIGMPGGSEWILIILFLSCLFIIPYVFYLITLQNTLKLIEPHNRTMPPSNVWLLFIPLFGWVWHFIVVKNMADSIKADAIEKCVLITEDKPGYSIGLAMCILNCCSIIPVINTLTSLASIVCWIIYWSKIASFKNQLSNAGYYSVDKNNIL